MFIIYCTSKRQPRDIIIHPGTWPVSDYSCIFQLNVKWFVISGIPDAAMNGSYYSLHIVKSTSIESNDEHVGNVKGSKPFKRYQDYLGNQRTCYGPYIPPPPSFLQISVSDTYKAVYPYRWVIKTLIKFDVFWKERK